MIGSTFLIIAQSILDQLASRGFTVPCYPIAWQLADGRVVTYMDKTGGELGELGVANDHRGAYIRDLDRFSNVGTGEYRGACNEVNEAQGYFKLVAFDKDARVTKYDFADIVASCIAKAAELPNTANFWGVRIGFSGYSTDVEKIFSEETKQEPSVSSLINACSFDLRISFKYNDCSFEPKTFC